MIQFTKPTLMQFEEARVCEECSALVFNIDVHLNWHAHVRTNG